MIATYSLGRVDLSSTWRGYYRSVWDPQTQTWSSELVYTTPTAAVFNKTVDLGGVPAGAIIKSASLTYAQGGTSYYTGVRFADKTPVAAETLKSKIEAMGGVYGALTLQFYHQQVGGGGGVGDHTSAHSWTSITLTVNYTPAARIAEEVSSAAGTFTALIDAVSLAAGETCSCGLVCAPTRTVVKEQLILSSAEGDSVLDEWTETIAAGQVQTLEGVLTMTDDVTDGLLSRVESGILTVRVYTDADTAVSSQPQEIDLNIVADRTAPAVGAPTLSDTAGHLTTFGAYVQGQSLLRLTMGTVTLDTAADPDITVRRRSLRLVSSIADRTIDLFGDPADIGAITGSGTVSWTLSVTDSYGQTGTRTGTITVLPYAVPSFSALELVRYVLKEQPGGGYAPAADDDGTKVWLTCEGAVSALNGKNAWTLAAEWDGTPHTLLSGSDGADISKDADITALQAFTFAAANEHAVTLTLADEIAETVYSLVIPKAGAILSIEVGGVSVGRRNKRNKTDPAFESGYPAVLYGGLESVGRTVSSLAALGIRTGKIAVTTTIGANSYHDFAVTFPQPYAAGTAPTMAVSVVAGYTGGTNGKLTAAIVPNTTTNEGFMLRISNSDSSGRMAGAQWIAFGVPDGGEEAEPTLLLNLLTGGAASGNAAQDRESLEIITGGNA